MRSVQTRQGPQESINVLLLNHGASASLSSRHDNVKLHHSATLIWVTLRTLAIKIAVNHCSNTSMPYPIASFIFALILGHFSVYLDLQATSLRLTYKRPIFIY